MATIEELDELSVEIINSINGEEEESKENASSPARAHERPNSESTDASVVALPSSKAVVDDSDDDDDVTMNMKQNLIIIQLFLYSRNLMKQFLKDWLV